MRPVFPDLFLLLGRGAAEHVCGDDGNRQQTGIGGPAGDMVGPAGAEWTWRQTQRTVGRARLLK